MNFMSSKTFLGLITVFVSSALGLLRALGVPVPVTVDPAINQLLVNGVGLYLLISGHQEALYTTPPQPSSYKSLPAGGASSGFPLVAEAAPEVLPERGTDPATILANPVNPAGATPAQTTQGA
jgi:hypothetical protein